MLDRNVGPVTLVNTDVMGPGYGSAYGLVMGIHVDPKRGGFDNQIRTHGSVDYTSIARRFSHGCHRLVNNRAVRLYDFVLRHRAFKRIGNVPLNLKKRLEVDGDVYHYALKTRGYYYELADPVPVNVLEGRIMGEVKKPIVAYVRKPGVDYGPAPAVGDAATSTAVASPGGESAPEIGPELGPRAMTRAGLSALALDRRRSAPRLRRARARGEPQPAVALDLTLDPGASRAVGHARLRVVNQTGGPLGDIPLWLYPTTWPRARKALGDVNYHWLYPGRGLLAGGDDGVQRPRRRPPGGDDAEDTPAGARTIARVTLPAPLAPGAASTIDVDFDTKVPRRFGGFGCDGLRCRLMGGFYPMPAAQTAVGSIFARRPPRGRARVTLRAPKALALVVNGEPVVWPGPNGAVTVESADVPYPTIVTDRVLRPETVTVGGHVVRYLHRNPRPPGSEDQALPYVREDVTALVLKTAERALGARRRDALRPGLRAGARPAAAASARSREHPSDHADRSAAAPPAGPGARQRHPRVGSDLSHLPGQPSAQVPPSGAGPRHPGGDRRRPARRHRDGTRAKPGGRHARRLPDGALHAPSSSRRWNTPRICSVRSTSSPRSISSSTRRCSPRRRATSATCRTRIAFATTCASSPIRRRRARGSFTTSCSISWAARPSRRWRARR